MTDDETKAARDALIFGTGMMLDGKHVPMEAVMTDDLVKRLRSGDYTIKMTDGSIQYLNHVAADRIEELEDENKRLLANAKTDAKWLAVYHHWCKMNGYAPSSADLSIARADLEGEKKDG